MGRGGSTTHWLAALACVSFPLRAAEVAPARERPVVYAGASVIDGTGAASRADQVVVVQAGRIAHVGPAACGSS